MMTFPEFETFLKESFPEVSAEASERFRMMEAGLSLIHIYSLEEKIGLLKLVVEEHVVLREGEGSKVILLAHPSPQDIKSGAQPAAAGRLLIGASLGLHLAGEVGVNHGDVLGVRGQDIDGRPVQMCIRASYRTLRLCIREILSFP